MSNNIKTYTFFFILFILLFNLIFLVSISPIINDTELNLPKTSKLGDFITQSIITKDGTVVQPYIINAFSAYNLLPQQREKIPYPEFRIFVSVINEEYYLQQNKSLTIESRYNQTILSTISIPIRPLNKTNEFQYMDIIIDRQDGMVFQDKALITVYYEELVISFYYEENYEIYQMLGFDLLLFVIYIAGSIYVYQTEENRKKRQLTKN